MSASLAIVADAPAIAVHGAAVPCRQHIPEGRTYAYVFGTSRHAVFDGLYVCGDYVFGEFGKNRVSQKEL